VALAIAEAAGEWSEQSRINREVEVVNLIRKRRLIRPVRLNGVVGSSVTIVCAALRCLQFSGA
jgi:hypothetical protein